MHPQAGQEQLGGKVYAFSDMSDHMSMLREYFEHLIDHIPSMVGLGDCESLFAHLKNEKLIAEKFLARHFRPFCGYWRCWSWATFSAFLS